MGQTELALAAIAGVLVASLVGLAIGYGFRRAAQRRFDRLEEALRTYNNASAAVGRHVTALEQELQELRKRQIVAETVRSPLAAERSEEPQGAAGGRPGPRFPSAEARLADLIRSRLGAARTG